jgi:hypothetical protein
MGPLEYIAIGFEGNRFTGEIMPQIEAIRGQSAVRILDLVFVSRNRDGHLTSMELSDLPDDQKEKLSSVESSAGMWFAQDDIDSIGKDLPAETSVALILLEHLWARKIQESVERANGRLIGEGFVPRAVVDELETLIGARAQAPLA